MPNQNFTDGLFDRVDLFYMRNNRSDLIPARLEHVQRETKRNQQSFFVKFDMIASRSDAESAMNRALFVEREHTPAVEPGESPSVVGYTLWYDGKEYGEVLDVLENPAHPILEASHNIGSVLIPVVDEYVERTDHQQKIVFCKNLDQLTDL